MNKLTKKAVCERLNISPRQLDHMVSRNDFPRGVRDGKSHVWAEEVVERFDRERFQDQFDWFERR